jgi:excisionase family DNA binding protein
MLTSTKVGRLLGLSKKTILDLARDGRIPSIILPSGHRRFDVEEVKAALKDPLIDEPAVNLLDPVGRKA